MKKKTFLVKVSSLCLVYIAKAVCRNAFFKTLSPTCVEMMTLLQFIVLITVSGYYSWAIHTRALQAFLLQSPVPVKLLHFLNYNINLNLLFGTCIYLFLKKRWEHLVMSKKIKSCSKAETQNILKVPSKEHSMFLRNCPAGRHQASLGLLALLAYQQSSSTSLTFTIYADSNNFSK